MNARLLAALLSIACFIPASALAFCGDGILDSGETCDDLNSSSNDGCSASCQT